MTEIAYTSSGPVQYDQHGSTHQEISGTDQLVDFGLFERIARVTKTTSNATPVMFAGVANNADNTLQGGHGWTSSGNANGSMNYTGDSIIGTQCIKITTQGNGSSTTVTSPRETAVNVTAKMIRIWLKFDAASYMNLGQCLLTVGSGASQFLNFASLQLANSGMNQLTQYAKAGEWVCWTFNPASFVNITGTMDWTALQDFRLNIKDNNTGNPATVLFGGIDFIPNDSTYPNGVVSFTFDDSYVGQFTYAKPKLEQYGYKGTFYLIYDVIGANPTLYMTKAQIDQLLNLGHEIAFHSHYVADHNIAGGFTRLSLQQLMLDWGQHKGWYHRNGYRGINHMALPQGMMDLPLLSVLKQQFAAVRNTFLSRIETIPVADPYRLCAASTGVDQNTPITPNTQSGTIEWYLDQIFSFGGWLIFFTHNLVTSGAAGTDTLNTNFNTIVDYVATKGIPVRTVGDVLGI